MKVHENIQQTFPVLELPEDYLSVIENSPGTDRQYLGQPDSVMLNDEETLFLVYPIGHGAGEIILQKSTDKGETWTEIKDKPETWKESLETPTLYHLNKTTGEEVLILISGCPKWKNNTTGGWRTSLSLDRGQRWHEFSENHHPTLPDETQNFSTVAMSSLVQLKDENGQDLDQWLGIYHNAAFVNFSTVLSFNEKNEDVWSEPVPMLQEHRELEEQLQICEIGLFRSPDDQKIVAIGRTQSHTHPSVLFFSEDEGKTWSKPEFLPAELHGERHKIAYDPVSKRLLITYRELRMWEEEGELNWIAGDWAAWVGSYDQLMQGEKGEKKVILAKDYTNSPKSGDTGYAGLVVDSDGVFILHSYGHWDEDFSRSWTGSVTEDLCYIIQAKFKLEDLE